MVPTTQPCKEGLCIRLAALRPQTRIVYVNVTHNSTIPPAPSRMQDTATRVQDTCTDRWPYILRASKTHVKTYNSGEEVKAVLARQLKREPTAPEFEECMNQMDKQCVIKNALEEGSQECSSLPLPDDAAAECPALVAECRNQMDKIDKAQQAAANTTQAAVAPLSSAGLLAKIEKSLSVAQIETIRSQNGLPAMSPEERAAALAAHQKIVTANKRTAAAELKANPAGQETDQSMKQVNRCPFTELPLRQVTALLCLTLDLTAPATHSGELRALALLPSTHSLLPSSSSALLLPSNSDGAQSIF